MILFNDYFSGGGDVEMIEMFPTSTTETTDRGGASAGSVGNASAAAVTSDNRVNTRSQEKEANSSSVFDDAEWEKFREKGLASGPCKFDAPLLKFFRTRCVMPVFLISCLGVTVFLPCLVFGSWAALTIDATFFEIKVTSKQQHSWTLFLMVTTPTVSHFT